MESKVFLPFLLVLVQRKALLCNMRGWRWNGRTKEIKKLWNLSENLFSSKFHAENFPSFQRDALWGREE